MHVVVIEIRPSKLCGINTLVAISPLLGNVIRSAIPLHAVNVARFKPMQSSISKQGYLIYVINHNKYCYGPDWRRCHFIYVCCRHSEPFVLTAFINRSEIYLNFSVESTFHSFFLTPSFAFSLFPHIFFLHRCFLILFRRTSSNNLTVCVFIWRSPILLAASNVHVYVLHFIPHSITTLDKA